MTSHCACCRGCACWEWQSLLWRVTALLLTPENGGAIHVSYWRLGQSHGLVLPVQVVDSTGKVLFQQPPAGTVAVPVDTLPAGRTLAQNQRLYSKSAQYFLEAQGEPT